MASVTAYSKVQPDQNEIRGEVFTASEQVFQNANESGLSEVTLIKVRMTWSVCGMVDGNVSENCPFADFDFRLNADEKPSALHRRLQQLLPGYVDQGLNWFNQSEQVANFATVLLCIQFDCWFSNGRSIFSEVTHIQESVDPGEESEESKELQGVMSTLVSTRREAVSYIDPNLNKAVYGTSTLTFAEASMDDSLSSLSSCSSSCSACNLVENPNHKEAEQTG